MGALGSWVSMLGFMMNGAVKIVWYKITTMSVNKNAVKYVLQRSLFIIIYITDVLNITIITIFRNKNSRGKKIKVATIGESCMYIRNIIV